MPKRRSIDLDDLALELLLLLEKNYGVITADPGHLIAQCATELFGEEVAASAFDKRYCAMAIVIRNLEALGLVRVDRLSHEEPERGNKLCTLILTMDET